MGRGRSRGPGSVVVERRHIGGSLREIREDEVDSRELFSCMAIVLGNERDSLSQRGIQSVAGDGQSGLMRLHSEKMGLKRGMRSGGFEYNGTMWLGGVAGRG